jgi:hypothetical protein
MEEPATKEQKIYEKPYFAIKLVNDTLTVVLADGTIITKPGATEDDYFAVQAARDLYEIHAVIASKEVKQNVEDMKAEAERIKALQKGIQLLGDFPDFEVEGQSVYLSGTSRSMPQLLVEKFIEIVNRVGEQPADHSKTFHEALNEDDDYMAHKNFFMWCCLNPRAEVANELYRFLTDNKFKITKQGFFVALRNVVTLHGSPELVHFVSNAYNKVKAVWKKNPDNYTVFLQDGEYKLVHDSALTIPETHTSTTCPECEGEGQYEDWDDEPIFCEECNGEGEIEPYTYTVDVPVDHGQKIGGLTELYLDLPNREENRFRL